MPSSQSTQYCLAPHAHACRAGDHVVLLDLKRDEYLGFDASDDLVLESLIEGWPVKPTSVRSAIDDRVTAPTPMNSTDDSGETLLKKLLEAGLLVRMSPRENTRDVQTSSASGIHRAETALIEGYTTVSASVRWQDVLHFVMAAATARVLLRWRSIEQVVAHVRRRTDKLLSASTSRPSFDLDNARRKVTLFRRLRPFLFTAHDACLYDSLALSEFLAAYRLTPHWVFGVATDPFAAHCWLQQGSIVINDSPEYVRRFTPILII